MKRRMLSCFRDFQCVANKCRDSCCVGWEIDVDEETFQRYQSLTGPFGEEIRSNIATEADGSHHYMLSEGKRCPFLRQDGLCRQILELGEEALCEICALHPRFFELFGAIEEMGMGLACQEAARLLFESDEPLTLLEQGEGEGPKGEDGELYEFLLSWREHCFAAAQDESLDIYERLGEVLALGRRAAAQLRGEEELEGPLEVCPGQGVLWLDYLAALESIDGEWTAALEDAMAAAQYPELMEEFAQTAGERSYDRLLVYLLFRYALKALWDAAPEYWANFAVFGVLTVELLDFGRWLRNGQRFSAGDREDMARIFSKQVEYDTDIVEGLGDLFAGTEPFCYGKMQE